MDATSARRDPARRHINPVEVDRVAVSRRRVLVACCIGLFMVFVQITQTISVLARVQVALGLTATQLVWVSSSYTLAVAAGVLSGGALGDRFGRRRVYLSGIAVMGVGTATVAAADSFAVLVTGQALSGVGAAAVLPTSLSIITVTFTEPERRARAIAVWVGASGLGLALGPVIAGALLERFDWNVVFLVNLPVAMAGLVLSWRVPDTRLPGARLDVAGQLLIAVGLGALVVALVQAGQAGGIVPIGAFALAVVALVGLVVVERRTPEPLLDVRLLARPGYAAALTLAAVGLFGFVGVSLLLVLYLQRVQGLGPLHSGVQMLAVMASFVLVTVIAGRVVGRLGPRRLLVAGALVAGVAALSLTLLQPATPFGRSWPALALLGAGCGLLLAPSTVAAVAAVPAAVASKAAAAVNAARQLGAALGASIVGAVATGHYLEALPAELAARAVPPAAAAEVTRSVASGTTAAGPLPVPVSEALGAALIAGVHAGVVTVGAVFLAAAVLAVVAIGRPPSTTTVSEVAR